MNSIQISIDADEPQQEILISRLSDLGAEGFEQTDKSLLAYFPETGFQSDEVQQVLHGFTHRITTVEEQNWNAVWESNFDVVIVDDFCAVRAEFHAPVPTVEYEIVITPKMSFGTGHHATTYMMMQQMRHLDFKRKTVFDFGTGTGVLAILAEKLGAVKIMAIDVDNWSIENAQENADRNGCQHITLELSTNIPPGNFDIILANINRNVILNYLPLLKTSLAPGSRLLLSGLLAADEADIVEACKVQGLKLLRKMDRNGWISLLMNPA